MKLIFLIRCDVIPRDIRKRNSVFFSITRSRGWTYLTGTGDESNIIKSEIDEIVKIILNLYFQKKKITKEGFKL